VNDRIKLAEAMGWHRADDDVTVDFIGGWCPKEQFHYGCACPDPFTDANDDVAILNFYGDAEDSPERERFLEILYGQQMLDYKIGDYARAALRVLDND